MAYTDDLTQGVIWKKLVHYTLPLVLSSSLQAMYGIVDMIVAGHFIGSAGLSAINSATVVMNAVTQVVMGISIGGNVVIAQYFGAMDKKRLRDSCATLFTLSLIIGVTLAAFFFAASRPILAALKAPALEDATGYLKICSTGIIFITGYNATSAMLRAVGNSRAPLICIAVTAVVNIILDIIFVVPLDMGVNGTALATIIAQGMSFIASLFFVLHAKDVFGLRLTKLYMNSESARFILKVGLPCSVQMSAASISWLGVSYIINSYGMIISAGNGISVKIKDFSQLFTSAICNGAAAMIAQNIGAGEFDRAKKTMYSAMKMSVGMAIVIIAVIELFAPQLASLFTSDADTIAAAIYNLRIEIIGQLFYAVFFMYHAIAIGAGDTWYVFFSSFVNCILARLPLAFLLSHFFGLNGLYIACMVSPFFSIPVGMVYIRSSRWRRALIVSGKTPDA